MTTGPVQDRAGAKERVVDLSTFRETKQKTGTGVRANVSGPESPKFTREADEAMAIANGPKKKATIKDGANKVANKVYDYLGLNE